MTERPLQPTWQWRRQDRSRAAPAWNRLHSSSPFSRQGIACAVDGIGVLVHAAKVTASAAPNIREESVRRLYSASSY